MKPAPIGIFARVFAGGTAGAVAGRVRAAGYRLTQLNLKVLGLPTLPEPADWERTDGRAIEAAFSDAGVSISGVSATYNMCHPDPEIRRAGTLRARDLISHARDLGTGLVTLCTGSRDGANMWAPHPANRSTAAWRDFRVELDILIQAARDAGVRLGIEPETGAVVDDAEATLRLLAELGEDAHRIGVVLDPANLLKDRPRPQSEILQEAFTLLGRHVVCLHAKDGLGWDAALSGRGGVDFELVGRLRRVYAPGTPVIVQDIDAARAAQARQYVDRAVNGPPPGRTP